jgi:leucyl-tRNA synthetase
MSKSKNNGVDPQELIDRYGADTARLFVMFASPPEQTVEWNDAGVEGANRFLRRVWSFGVRQEALTRGSPVFPHDASAGADAKALRREIHSVLRQVSYDYERMQYNTVVSGAMKMLNALEAVKDVAAPGVAAAVREGYSILLRALYPACPHTAWVLWRDLGYSDALGDLLDAPWPTVDPQALVQDEIELMLQVNGKLRGSIRVPAGASEREIEIVALASPAFQRHAEGRAIRMVKVVPGRLVNIVV